MARAPRDGLARYGLEGSRCCGARSAAQESDEDVAAYAEDVGASARQAALKAYLTDPRTAISRTEPETTSRASPSTWY
jgi:hypothetical protein